MTRLLNFDKYAALEAVADQSGLSFEKDLLKFEFITEKIKVLPYAYVKKKCIIPLKEEEGVLYIAIQDPYDLETSSEVKCMTGSFVKEVLASKEAIEEAIEKCYADKEDASLVIQELDQEKSLDTQLESSEEYDLLAGDSDSSIIKIFNTILVEALNSGASDIHLEPIEKGIQVRYRIDGMLQVRHTLSKDVQLPLATRIKVLAKLDIAEQRLPQDGRIKLRMGGREIDFRVSTIPVVFGERVCLRILDRSQLQLGLDQLGIRAEMLHVLRKQIRKNQGILLVTGPTGSGKTTTLYSMLSEIRSPDVNIMTIEDPVEFKLEGLAQIGVNPKIDLNFAKGLRHILRQDPDVIMIGEIRDKETAEIAIQASLTGHLVISTLHTNDAPSAIARLVDMGIEPYLLTSSLIGVLAQRLVRKICPKCKISYEPTKGEIVELGLKNQGVETSKIVLYKGKGCQHCFNTGYKGREGVYEFMPVSLKIKQQVLSSADSTKLQKIALDEGMLSLRKEGILLALSGATSLEEVLRVSRQLDEEV
ncbi:MAG: type II secretion system protein GspE [Chlamydiae bacterium]|jgi:general secretion pathway protein E|nr:type II secretion system protein GspE [Chlamydiota bacterium]